jgi:hypothetical protein
LLPEDHQTKIAALSLAPNNVRIEGVGIRSDDAVSWGVRYIIDN